MIHELEPAQFHRCRNLVNRGINLESKAIIAGMNPGRVFVDDVDHPRSGMIWQGNLDGFHFVGDSGNPAFNYEIRAYIDTIITPQAVELGVEWFECLGDHPSWYRVFQEELFADRHLAGWNQYVYNLNPADFRSIRRPELGADYEVQQVTMELLRNHPMQHLEMIEATIGEFWQSQEDFLENGLGFCVLYHGQVVSLCMTGFRYRNIHALDIKTMESHRGNKLAQCAVYAMVEHCLRHDFIPYWDCSEGNLPSNGIARRIGFQIEFAYEGYEFNLVPS